MRHLRHISTDLRLVLLGLILLGAPILFLATYTGPFKWVCEAELAMFGSYGIKVSLLCTLVVWVVLFIVALVLCFFLVGERLVDYYVIAPADEPFQNGQYRAMLFLSFLATAVCFGIAGCANHLTATSARQTRVSLNALIAGQRCPSRSVVLFDASADEHGGLSTEERTAGGNKESTTYFALLPKDYQPSSPVYAFLEQNRGAGESFRVPSDSDLKGEVSFTGLPGRVREGFRRAGLPPSAHYILLTNDASGFAFHAAAIGWICAVVTVLFLVFRGKLRTADGAFAKAAEDAKPIGYYLDSKKLWKAGPAPGPAHDEFVLALGFSNNSDKDVRSFTGTVLLSDLADRVFKTVPIGVEFEKPTAAGQPATLSWDVSVPCGQWPGHVALCWDQLTLEQRKLVKGKNLRIKLIVSEVVNCDGSKQTFGTSEAETRDSVAASVSTSEPCEVEGKFKMVKPVLQVVFVGLFLLAAANAWREWNAVIAGNDYSFSGALVVPFFACLLLPFILASMIPRGISDNLDVCLGRAVFNLGAVFMFLAPAVNLYLLSHYQEALHLTVRERTTAQAGTNASASAVAQNGDAGAAHVVPPRASADSGRADGAPPDADTRANSNQTAEPAADLERARRAKLDEAIAAINVVADWFETPAGSETPEQPFLPESSKARVAFGSLGRVLDKEPGSEALDKLARQAAQTGRAFIKLVDRARPYYDLRD